MPKNPPLAGEQTQLRVVELEARVAELEAQLATSTALWVPPPNDRLNTLLAVSSALLVTHDTEAILRLLVREAPALFPGTSCATLFLVDADRQGLTLRAASKSYHSNLTIQPGRGVAGHAFLAPRAMLMVGPELALALEELDDQQRTQFQQLLKPWPPLSALLAPLRVEGQRLGSLVLYGGTHAHLFHPRDLPFIQALADLAASAIAENQQRERAGLLQHALTQTQSLHAEAQVRLDAAQAQLLQSAKLAAVGELAASVAHEISNPLYAARNSLYLVEQELPPDAPQRPFLTIAQTELGRIAGIITRMRDFYRPTRDELEPTDLNALLLETVELVQTHLRHGQVSVVTELADKLPPIIAHTDQLRQVMLNLLLNACDAMPSGGTLRLSTERQPMQIAVRVADTGSGIPAEHMPRLFEPFYTTKAQGTGLGLAISAHIVTQHGGQINVKSSVGVGSTFTVTLPLE